VVRALAALALLAAAPAAAEPPLCRAEVSVEPARAFVGEPVLHRVRIVQRREVVDMRWETSLSFPAFRAERILGPDGPRAEDAATETTEERRVLFPGRAGRLALPAASVACESAARVETAEVPAAEVVAEEPPAAGRPAGWEGLIGPVELSVHATPDRVALGQSVTLAVTVQGGTNVWTAPVAFAIPLEAAEVFERPSELSRDMGRSLGLRWYRNFDVVPRRAGVLEIPELRVAWFDPHTRRWGETRAGALRIEVSERAASAPAPAPPGEEPPAPAPGAGRFALAAAALALGAAAGVGVGLRLRRRPRAAVPLPVASPDQRAEARAALDRALAQSDGPGAAAAAARWLRLALEATLPGARSLAAEELTARAPGPRAALLARLELRRFGGAADAELLALAREAAATEPSPSAR
jgi:hypothetical protein